MDDGDDDDGRSDVCQVLPNHLIYDILLKLPATTLMRFRSVSKEWSKIISTPSVRKHHFLIHSNNTISRKSKNIFIHFWSKKYNEVLQFTITESMIASWYDDVRNARSIASCSLTQPVSLRFPINIGYSNGHASPSSCHGLLCLKIVHSNTYKGSVFVWNPVTSQLRQVPCPTEHHLSSFIGFGCDDVTGDYKIVLTKSGWIGSTGRPQIMSLTSSNCIWRKIDTPSWGKRVSNSVTIGGDIYWISYIRRADILKVNYWASQNLSEDWYYVILKFNVTNERLTVLPTPLEKEPSDKKRMEIGQYKGSLCFFSIQLSLSDDPRWATIWTLRDHNNGEVSWKRLMDVPNSLFSKNNGKNCKLEFTTNGDLLICSAGYGLLVYLAQEKRYVEVSLNENDPKHEQLKFARDFYFLQNESLLSPLSQ